MILRSLGIQIGDLRLPKDYTYAFKKNSRFICNWMDREVLKRLRFETDGFFRIVVGLCSVPRPNAHVNTSNVACVDIDFNREKVDAANDVDLARLQIAMLKSGIEKCALTYSIPKTELLQGLDLFTELGMKNEWLHKKRTFKKHHLSASLNCKMTQTDFSLWLSVLHQNTSVFEEVILKTDPDEIVFDSKFSDIEVSDGNLVITAKIGPPLWTKPLTELLR